MTNQLLQSDIDLAARMMDSGHTDAEIVEALAQRRIDIAKATQVVTALRSGQKVEPELQVSEETGSRGHRRERSAQSTQSREQRHSAPHKSSKGWLIWALLGIAVAALAGYFLFARSAGSKKEPGFEVPSAPVETAPEPKTSPQSAPDGRRSAVAQ